MTGILRKCLTLGPYMEIIYMCDGLKSFFEKPRVGLDKIHVCLFVWFLFFVI